MHQAKFTASSRPAAAHLKILYLGHNRDTVHVLLRLANAALVQSWISEMHFWMDWKGAYLSRHRTPRRANAIKVSSGRKGAGRWRRIVLLLPRCRIAADRSSAPTNRASRRFLLSVAANAALAAASLEHAEGAYKSYCFDAIPCKIYARQLVFFCNFYSSSKIKWLWSKFNLETFILNGSVPTQSFIVILFQFENVYFICKG